MAQQSSTAKPPHTPPIMAKRLARALAYVAEDLVNPYDESTDTFHGFNAPFDSNALPEAALRAALHVSDRYRLDTWELDPHVFDESGEPYVSSYAILVSIMRATLTDVKVVVARAQGVVRVRTWIIGRLGDHWLVGLRTESTET